MIIGPFLLSFLAGYLLLRIVVNAQRPLTWTDILMVPGIGLGISSQVVFYSLMALNRIEPAAVLALHFVVIMVLLLMCRKYVRQKGGGSLHQAHHGYWMILLLPFLVYFFIIALSRPYGLWDAWAFWNFRANYLFRAGEHWTHILIYGCQGQHPWFLPFAIVWGWAFYGHETPLAPIIVAVIFSLSTAGLLMAALLERINRIFAAGAGLLLLSLPYFGLWGTSQYADVLTAYFLLATVIYFLKSVENNAPGCDARLAGISLGLLAFTKDNGLVAALLLALMAARSLFRAGRLKEAGLGFLWVCIPVFVTKWWSCLTVVSHPYAALFANVLNMGRWQPVFQSLLRAAVDPGWGGAAMISLLAAAVSYRQMTKNVFLLWAYILTYLGLYFLMFVVSTYNINWLLGSALDLDRLVFLLMPAVLFLSFCCFKGSFDKNRLLTANDTFRFLSLAAAVYVLVFFSWCCLKYYCFAYDDFDLAQHDQIVWNILHGRIFNSVLGIPFLGNHVHLISFLVAPFYWFVPHPLFLLFLQTVFLAAGVFPLYALAKRYLDFRMALVVGLIYLIYPGLGYTNLFEFHPPCFAPFFILCAAYYFYKENFFRFNIFMFLTLDLPGEHAADFHHVGDLRIFVEAFLEMVAMARLAGTGLFFAVR